MATNEEANEMYIFAEEARRRKEAGLGDAKMSKLQRELIPTNKYMR
jgi:hypothetical protein